MRESERERGGGGGRKEGRKEEEEEEREEKRHTILKSSFLINFAHKHLCPHRLIEHETAS